ncbi:hypothetical protein D8674_027494 [Pyrus ussuriensis x Pyrus communis]|uniref:Uncharacterized protein n=1 Tax=Pyrus ussuriensis x Pyrus communis TaxID=2448454 RepID=A0A5N5IH78_9ROSA|nr:hypothetical protein D8674_027494 [Pyrus ussuriensis x Pyrus communis]
MADRLERDDDSSWVSLCRAERKGDRDSGREGKGTSRLTNLRETVAPIFDSETAGCRRGKGREGTERLQKRET